MPTSRHAPVAPIERRPAQGSGPFSRQELIRVLQQSLQDLGLEESFRTLQQESRVNLEAPIVAEFRAAVLEGRWETAEAELARAVSDESVQISAPPPGAFSDAYGASGSSASAQGAAYVRFQLYEQQYLELLEARQVSPALRILRERLAPLAPQATRLQILSALVLCESQAELYERANWDGAHGTSRRRLMDRIESVVDTESMLPSGRLLHLLEQAAAFQRVQDPYYTADVQGEGRPSLLTDFTASPDTFPRQLTHTLRGHTDEVWIVRFSHAGKLLATAGRDCVVTLWDIDDGFCMVGRFGHRDPVSSLDFSPDDTKLLVASEEEITVWDLATTQGATYVEHEHTVSSARWLPPIETLTCPQGQPPVFVSGAMDRAILFWGEDGKVLSRYDMGPFRVTALDVSPDGRYMVALGWSPPPSKSSVRPEMPLREGRTRHQGLTHDSSTTTLLPLSLTGGAFIPYDIRHYTSVTGRGPTNFDLLSVPPSISGEDAPHSRRAPRPPSDEPREAIEEPTEEVPAAQSSRERRPGDHARILIYDLHAHAEICSLYVRDMLNSVAISSDSRFALLSGIADDIVLLELSTQNLLQHYHGHRASEFVIRATFGGAGEDLAGGISAPFVASGSEDARIYVWHRASGRLLENSCAHSHGAVNDVAWRPRHAHMMASGGDDGLVRIWQPTLLEKEPIQRMTKDDPVQATSRTGTFAHLDWQRPTETKDEPMEDEEAPEASPDDVVPDLARPGHRRNGREATPAAPAFSGRIRALATPERAAPPAASHTSAAPSRPHLLPW